MGLSAVSRAASGVSPAAQPTQNGFQWAAVSLSFRSTNCWSCCLCIACVVCETRLTQQNRHVNHVSGNQVCLAYLKQTSKAHTLSWSCTSHTDNAAVDMCSFDWWCQYHMWLGAKHDGKATDSQLWFCTALTCVSMHRVVVMTEKDVSQKQLPAYRCVPPAAAQELAELCCPAS